MASFSSSAFSTGAFSITAFDFDPSAYATATPDTHDGGSEDDYRRYRKHLEKIAKLASEDRKYLKTAIDDVEALAELPIDTPELEKITGDPILQGTLRLMPEINYAQLQKELDLIGNYLDIMIRNRAIMEQERDDEAAFLLLID